MARKSKEKRINDTTSTIEAYEAAGFVDDYRVRFMKDMVRRLNAGRGISSKQRNWLDALHEDGAPEAKGDPALVKRIDDALSIFRRDTRAIEALTSFKSRVISGRTLSEKQNSFLNTLLAKADFVKENGFYRPEEDVVEDLKIALAVIRARVSWIGQNKPGTYKAFEKIQSWMVSEELLNKGEIEENLFMIDEWTVNKVLDAGRVALREIKNPKFPVGSMCYVYGRHLGLISSEPTVDVPNFRGKVQCEVLVDGEMKWIEIDSLAKRRRKS